jgi:predicted nucleic acid-binding protein
MKLTIDSSVFIALEKKDSRALQLLSELHSFAQDDPCLTAPAFSEIYYGYLTKPKPDYASIKKLGSMELLNTSKESSVIMAELKKKAFERGRPLPIADLMIASITIANGATLVTKDAHFKEIPGLDVVVLD